MDDKKKKKDKILAIVIIVILILLTLTWLVADYLGSKPKEPIPVVDDTPIIDNSDTVINDTTEVETEVSTEVEQYGEPEHFEYGELSNFVSDKTMKLIVSAVPEDKLSILSTGISYTMLDEELTFVKYFSDTLILEDSQYTYTVSIEDGGVAVTVVKK